MHMQGFDLALFQQGAADQPSILLKHLDPNTRQEAQRDIAAYETKLKDERDQKKQKTAQARATNLPMELTAEQRRRMGTPKTNATTKRKRHPQTEDAKSEQEKPQRAEKGVCDVSSLQRSKNQGCLYESCMDQVDEKEGTCAL